MPARFVLVLFVLALTASTTSAQSRNEQSSGERSASELFESGVRELESDHYSAAKVLFEQSLALVPRPSTAFNLAVALHGLGELRDAEVMLLDVGRSRYGEANDAVAVAAADLLQTVRAAYATIEVVLVGAEQARVLVDEREHGVAGSNAPFELSNVEPGAHVITAVLVDATRTTSVSVDVESGSTSVVELRFVNLAVPLEDDTTRPQESEHLQRSHREEETIPVDPSAGTSRTRRRRAILITVVSALALGGAVSVGLWLRESPTRIEDEIFGETYTLRAP